MSVWSASSSVWLRSKTVSEVLCTMLFRKNQRQHGNELPCLSIDGLTIGKLLGRGGFGKVFAVAKDTGKLEIMACKIFDMNGLMDSNGVKLQAEVANALAEIEVMKYMSSCSLSSIAPIVHLLDVYDASDGRPCAAMELCLEYVNDEVFEGRGTEGYSAPELVNGGYLSKAADIWSLGATLLEMLTGEEVLVRSVVTSEWWTKDAVTKLEQGLSDTVNGWKELDGTTRDLILAMLCPDFMERLPLTQVLIHPWLLNNLFHAPLTQEGVCTDACSQASTAVE
ncbi:hypothetical protein KP509_1Z136200 [Ceratopteris richardii]|nr:hypothetical protein KP509_1Z136200 [Ceratopteris richardii]